MSGAVLNSRLIFMRLLTSGEEAFERMFLLKEDISSTTCELTMLILFMFVTFSDFFTVASSITKSCRPMSATLVNTFLFIYKVVHQQIWGAVVDLRMHLVAVNLCLQQ